AAGADPSKSALRSLLHNGGSAVQDVLIGYETGRGLSYVMKFIAMAPDGSKREGFHKSVFTPIAGLVLPFSLRLTAGAIHELEFALTDIIYPSRTTATLEALVKEAYSIRVRFEANQLEAD